MQTKLTFLMFFNLTLGGYLIYLHRLDLAGMYLLGIVYCSVLDVVRRNNS